MFKRNVDGKFKELEKLHIDKIKMIDNKILSNLNNS